MLTTCNLTLQNIADRNPRGVTDIIGSRRFTARIFAQHRSQQEMEPHAATAVVNDHIDIGQIPRGSPYDTGFLPQFTGCGCKGRFAKINMPSGKAPETGIRFVLSLHE